MKYNVVDSIWFTQMGNPRQIGIVKVEDPYEDQPQFFIGNSDGLDKLDDEHSLLQPELN